MSRFLKSWHPDNFDEALEKGEKESPILHEDPNKQLKFLKKKLRTCLFRADCKEIKDYITFLKNKIANSSSSSSGSQDFGRHRKSKRKPRRRSCKSRRKSRRHSRKSIGGCRIKRKPRGSRQKTYFTNKSGVEYVKVNPRCGVRRKHRSRRFGYSHNQGPHMYNAHYSDGILLADNAFSWMGNPEARSENA